MVDFTVVLMEPMRLWITEMPLSLPACTVIIIMILCTIYVIDINVKHVHRQYPFSHPELSGTVRCILELLCISNNEIELPGFTKSYVDTMINTLCTC